MKWRWARDNWTTRQGLLRFTGGYDKIEHALFFGAVYLAVRIFGLSVATAWWAAAVFALANEVKDALMPWEKWGVIGGDGFSWRDFIASVGGIALCWLLDMLARAYQLIASVGGGS